MSRCYLQIGVEMNYEHLNKVKQDIEQLILDVKKLIGDADVPSNQEMKNNSPKMYQSLLALL